MVTEATDRGTDRAQALRDELVAKGLLPDPRGTEVNMMAAGMRRDPMVNVAHELLAIVVGMARQVNELEEFVESQRHTIVNYDRAIIRSQAWIRETNDRLDADAKDTLYGVWYGDTLRHALADVNG